MRPTVVNVIDPDLYVHDSRAPLLDVLAGFLCRAACERSGNGAERAENGVTVSGSGAVSGHSRKRLSGNGAWRAGVTEIGLIAERQILRSHALFF